MATIKPDILGNYNITSDIDGRVIIDGLSYPKTDGTSGQAIITDGNGILSLGDAGDADQNLFETITADSGSTTANTTTDTLHFNGSTGISTTVSGDTVSIVNVAFKYLSVASDSGTASAGTSSDTLTIAGGTGISTGRSGNTITITNTNDFADNINTHFFNVNRTTSYSLLDGGAATVLPFDTEVFDDGANFDSTTNYDYDVPETGLYQLSCFISVDTSSHTTSFAASVDLYVDAVFTHQFTKLAASTADSLVMGGTIILSLTVGDLVDIRYAYNDNGGSSNAPIETGTACSFSGYRIGAL